MWYPSLQWPLLVHCDGPHFPDPRATDVLAVLLQDALESAMKNALWGHALLLASKMDSRTHARVMTRYTSRLCACFIAPWEGGQLLSGCWP